MTFKLIGGIGVDSGTVLVADPCYTHTEIPFLGNCREVIVAPPGGNGVILQTYCGDGNYPVWGQFDQHGRCERVIIDFTKTLSDDGNVYSEEDYDDFQP